MILIANTEILIIVFCSFETKNVICISDARSGVHIPNVDSDIRSHWFDKNLFGSNRVVFEASPSPDKAKLKIFNVSENDDGIYRCRVDFKASQTRTSRLNLTIIGKKSNNFFFNNWLFVFLNCKIIKITKLQRQF